MSLRAVLASHRANTPIASRSRLLWQSLACWVPANKHTGRQTIILWDQKPEVGCFVTAQLCLSPIVAQVRLRNWASIIGGNVGDHPSTFLFAAPRAGQGAFLSGGCARVVVPEEFWGCLALAWSPIVTCYLPWCKSCIYVALRRVCVFR